VTVEEGFSWESTLRLPVSDEGKKENDEDDLDDESGVDKVITT